MYTSKITSSITNQNELNAEPSSRVNDLSNDSPPDEFEAILNQLSALGSEIDQELLHSRRIEPQDTSFDHLGIASSTMESCTVTSVNSSVINMSQPTDKLADFKETERSGEQADGHYYNEHLHHFSHRYHSQMLGSNEPGEISSSTVRADSPDNDSAFSDSISLLSTEQSSSSSSSFSNSSTSARQSTGCSSSISTNSSLINVTTTDKQEQQRANDNQSCLKQMLSSSSSASLSNSSISTTTISQSSVTSTLNGAISSTANFPIDNQFSHLEQQQLFFEQLGDSVSSVNGQPIHPMFDKEKSFNSNRDEPLYIKVFAQDNSAKSLLADERMSIGAICQQLAAKNHISLNSTLCIIEHMPQLYLERFYEDHELLVENVLLWDHDTTNKLYFMQRSDKYDLFLHPEKYLISGGTTGLHHDESTLKSDSMQLHNSISNHLRTDLISQFFNNEPGMVKMPEIEGNLFLRTEGKKTWKKYFFTLRSSGLYFCPKGKPKSTKDLICLTTFELNCVYYGFGWKKKFKAPNDFGFAIKHPQVQIKSPKLIKYLCAENENDLKLWLTGIRIAKYGRRLKDNFDQFQMLTSSEHSMNLVNCVKSNSISYEKPDAYHDASSQQELDQAVAMRVNRITRDESARSSSTSSSSGCVSEGGQISVLGTQSTDSGRSLSGNSLGHTPQHTGHNIHYKHQFSGGTLSPPPSLPHSTHYPLHQDSQQLASSLHYVGSPSHQYTNFNHSSVQQSSLSLNNAFDADFPLGTIKRKPSVAMTPKIPLTNTTRNLALQSDDALLEVNENATPDSVGFSDDDIYGGGSGNSCNLSHKMGEHFQRGTFKTNTLRRFATDERIKQSKLLASQLKFSNQANYPSQIFAKSDSEEDLPPPPPPLSPSDTTLTEANSILSLNSSFPPPPPEASDNSLVLQSGSTLTKENSDIVNQNLNQRPLELLPAHLNYTSNTLQLQHKNPSNGARLSRRLSDLSSNSSIFLNHRNAPPMATTMNENELMSQVNTNYFNSGPYSRASIAASSIDPMVSRNSAQLINNSTSNLYSATPGFSTLKPFHSRGHSISGLGVTTGTTSRIQRQSTLNLQSHNLEETPANINNYSRQCSLASNGFNMAYFDSANGSPQANNHSTNSNLSLEGTFPFSTSSSLSANNIYETSPLVTSQGLGEDSKKMNEMQPPKPIMSLTPTPIQTRAIPPPSHYGIAFPTLPYSQSTNTDCSIRSKDYRNFVSDYSSTNSSSNCNSQNNDHMISIAQISGLPTCTMAPLFSPPPPPAASYSMKGVVQTGAIISIPTNKENIIYMSISPHLLQKHQQMQQQNTISDSKQEIYQTPPEAVFLKNMERVIQKKWHVAQMLTHDRQIEATPGQVLGFRDPAYLPPRNESTSTNSECHHLPYQPSSHQMHFPVQNRATTYTNTLFASEQSQIYGQHHEPLTPVRRSKSVRMADSPNILDGPPPSIPPPTMCPSPNHYSAFMRGQPTLQPQIYCPSPALSNCRKVPPPPPKRSENTHLTSSATAVNGTSSSLRQFF